ncbi:hypothetical protein JVU11DRAFT_8362 [Chiua virens]|nr:hypothetical protein JVU11DRAFT_8362 [Chiua virens]
MFTALDTHLEQMQISANRTDEVENLHSLRMLQLARTSRDAFAVRLQYHCVRVRELQMMCSMATDECEEAKTFLKRSEWQIGEIKHILDHKGVGLLKCADLFTHEESRRGLFGNGDDVCHFNDSRSSTPSYFEDS